MGTVYLARDRLRDVPVALKTVSRTDPARVAHLKREFRAVSSLRHPNLVELYDLVAEPGGCYFTMELVDGVDPRRWVRGPDADVAVASYDATISDDAEATILPTPATPTAPSGGVRAGGRLPPRAVPIDVGRVRAVLAQLADGLAFLHGRGVVHRDVKASNALARADGAVKLLDFGLAHDWRTRVDESGSAPSSGPLVGTVAYMAPEYLHGHRISPAMDLYALGVLAFELVTGAPPFAGSFYEVVAAHVEQRAPRAIAFNPAVPDDVDELIAMLLAKDPALRPSAEEVGDAIRGEGRMARRWARPRPRFVGRQVELGNLEALVRAAADGARVAVIAGPSGAGKSALCEELVARTPVRGVRVLRGRCDERERVPYRAFDAIVDQLAGELAQANLAVDDLPHAAALARVFPSLAAAVAPSVRDLAPATDLRVERERAFAALAALLRRRLGGRTALVLIDDLQWADDGSLELVEVLVADGGAVAIVATCTTDDGRVPPDVAAMLERLGPRGALVSLAPLEDTRVAELIRSVAPAAAATFVDDAVRAAAGNPYLAELVATELAAAIAEGAPVSESRGVPGAEARRLARLGEDERAVAAAAAAAGGAVAFAQLRHVTELAGERLQSALRGLELERILRTTSGGADVVYDFYHQRLRRAAYAAAPDAAALHRRFAGWLEAEAPAQREALAEHWDLAGEPARAAPWALAAADAAAGQLAFDHAARWYQRALELGLPDAEARRARERVAGCLLLSGAFAAAAARCRALAAERTGDERDRWLLRAAEAEIKLGELGPGMELIDRILSERGVARGPRRIGAALRTAGVAARLALPRRETAGDAILADAFRVVASFVSTPRPVDAFEFVLRSIELARRRGDVAGEAMGLAMVGAYVAVGTLGRLGDGLVARSATLARRSGDPYARMVSEAASGIQATLRGDWAAMRTAHDRGERICGELGLERSWEASFLRSYRALGELYAGEIDRAVELAGSLVERAGDLFTRAMVGSFRGRALVAAGRLEEAARSLDVLVRDPAAASGLPRMYRYVLEGELALAAGRWTDAVALADEMAAVARAEWLAVLPVVGVMRDVVAATGALGAGDARQARALARRIRRRAGASFYAPTAYRLEAQAEARLRDASAARALLARAREAAARRGGLVERAAIDALAGGPAPPAQLRAAVAWATAGAIHQGQPCPR